MPWAALAYMSVTMYFDSASAAFWLGRPAKPGAWPSRAATLNGAITGSSFQILCSSHLAVGGVAKPFCETNHLSKFFSVCIHFRNSFAASWFLEYFISMSD